MTVDMQIFLHELFVMAKNSDVPGDDKSPRRKVDEACDEYVIGVLSDELKMIFLAIDKLDKESNQNCYGLEPIMMKVFVTDPRGATAEEKVTAEDHMFNHRRVAIAWAIFWQMFKETVPSNIFIENLKVCENWQVVARPTFPEMGNIGFAIVQVSGDGFPRNPGA